MHVPVPVPLQVAAKPRQSMSGLGTIGSYVTDACLIRCVHKVAAPAKAGMLGGTQAGIRPSTKLEPCTGRRTSLGRHARGGLSNHSSCDALLRPPQPFALLHLARYFLPCAVFACRLLAHASQLEELDVSCCDRLSPDSLATSIHPGALPAALLPEAQHRRCYSPF